ncbi:MAG: D-alanine--D-alanine ligase family protein [Erysipelotrichaceae bacterium]
MIKIAVIFGGDSVEHEVSIISASQAMAAIDQSHYEVIPLYYAKNHQLYSSKDFLDIALFKDLKKLTKNYPSVMLYKENQKFYIQPIKGLFPRKEVIDLVIPVVHGTRCEDGSIQGFLETLGIPYSGSDVLAGAVGQDKVFMKHILENCGLPIVPWLWFYSYDLEDNKDDYLSKFNKLGYPLVIKPANLGSSVGITLVNNEAECLIAIELASQYDLKIVVEKAITHLREINASVLGLYANLQVSELEEVTKQDEILSYADKYTNNGKSKGMASLSRVCPAKVSNQMTEHIQELAIRTFKVLSCSGVARIDFLLDTESNKVYVNEINTNPGSLSFYLWEASGVGFPQLMEQLIQQAILRQRQREKMIFSYETNLLANFKGSKGTKK